MSLHRAQVVCFAALTALGLLVAATAGGYGIFAPAGRIGPGLLPLVAGLVLAGFSGALLIGQVRGDPGADTETEAGVDDAGRGPAQRSWILRRVLVLTAVAVAAVPVLGMVCAFGLLVLVISMWLEHRPLLPALVFSAGLAAVVHAVFAVALQVPLPTGVFGF